MAEPWESEEEVELAPWESSVPTSYIPEVILNMEAELLRLILVE